MRFEILHIIWVLLVGGLLFAEDLEKKPQESGSEGAFYSPFGKRDPFHVPILTSDGSESNQPPLQRYHLDQYKLRGILRGLGEAKAMFQDPTGKTHIVQQGDEIGSEKASISRIIKSEVIITQKTFNFIGRETLTEKVVALPKEVESEPEQLANAAKTSQQPSPGSLQPQPDPDMAYAPTQITAPIFQGTSDAAAVGIERSTANQADPQNSSQKLIDANPLLPGTPMVPMMPQLTGGKVQ